MSDTKPIMSDTEPNVGYRTLYRIQNLMLDTEPNVVNTRFVHSDLQRSQNHSYGLIMVIMVEWWALNYRMYKSRRIKLEWRKYNDLMLYYGVEKGSYIQPVQIHMAVFFCYLVEKLLVQCAIQNTRTLDKSRFRKYCRNTRPCITGHPVYRYILKGTC